MVNSSNQAVTHPPLDQILFLNYKGRDPSCFSFQTQASDLDTPCLDHGKTEDFPNKHPFKHVRYEHYHFRSYRSKKRRERKNEQCWYETAAIKSTHEFHDEEKSIQNSTHIMISQQWRMHVIEAIQRVSVFNGCKEFQVATEDGR